MIRTRLIVPLLLLPIAAGCSTPNAANIQLRKDNQALRDQIAQLQRQHAADAADLQSLQSRATTIPVLPQRRLESLFTVHGLKLGRLTGGADLDPAKAGDDGLKVYITPVDGAGDQIKAAGAFTIDAFDLADKDRPLVGSWTFPLQEASKNWYGQALLYCYVLTCPWQHGPPAHPDLTLKITFTDALTQRQFMIQKVVKVKLATDERTGTGAADRVIGSVSH